MYFEHIHPSRWYNVLGVTKRFLVGLKTCSSVMETIPATMKGAKNLWLDMSYALGDTPVLSPRYTPNAIIIPINQAVSHFSLVKLLLAVDGN